MTKIIYPATLSCVACGEVGMPIETGGSYHFVGIMNRPTDGGPCFPGEIYGVCPPCFPAAYLAMRSLLTRQQFADLSLDDRDRLFPIWRVLTIEQRAAWVQAMEGLATADLSDPLGEEVGRG